MPKLCRNAIIHRMFLELFDCRSWCNRTCTAKIQKNVCRMAGKIHWDPCSMSHSIPCSSSSCGWILGSSVKLEYRSSDSQEWPYLSSLGFEAESLDWGLTPSLPLLCWSLPLPLCRWNSLLVPFSGWSVRKSLSDRCFFPFEEPSLPLLPLDHQTLSSSDHHSGSCVCSSPRYATPVLFNPPLPFPFPLPLLFTWRLFKLTARCHPMSKNTIFHHQYSLVHQLLRQ